VEDEALVKGALGCGALHPHQVLSELDLDLHRHHILTLVIFPRLEVPIDVSLIEDHPVEDL